VAKCKYLIAILAIGVVVGCGKAEPPPLIAAIRARDYDKARELILSGVDVNARMPPQGTLVHSYWSGYTALELACSGVVPEDLVDLMLEHGADVNIRDNLSCAPLDYLLHKKTTYSDTGKFFHVLEVLVSHGIRVECLQANGAHALGWSVSGEDARELKILLKLNFSKPVLRNAFEEAVQENHVKSLRVLYDTLIIEKKMSLEDIVTRETAEQVRTMLEGDKKTEDGDLTSSAITPKPVAQASSLHPL